GAGADGAGGHAGERGVGGLTERRRLGRRAQESALDARERVGAPGARRGRGRERLADLLSGRLGVDVRLEACAAAAAGVAVGPGGAAPRVEAADAGVWVGAPSGTPNERGARAYDRRDFSLQRLARPQRPPRRHGGTRRRRAYLLVCGLMLVA